ncbi:MAG: hypothetical protein WCY89_09130 [Flavobacteriaceae bacterium]
MKKLLYILFCTALISCNSKTEEIKEEEIVVFLESGTTIYESDIYEVINTFFEDEKETNILDGIDYEGKLLTVYPNSDYIHSEDLGEFGIITEEDRNFIFRQVGDLRKYDLKQEHISRFRLIPIDTMKVFMDYVMKQEKRNLEEISEKFQNQFQTNEFYIITIPLFSLDKKTAIITFGYQFVPNGGNGNLYVYKKENDKWIRTDKGFMWL